MYGLSAHEGGRGRRLIVPPEFLGAPHSAVPREATGHGRPTGGAHARGRWLSKRCRPLQSEGSPTAAADKPVREAEACGVVAEREESGWAGREVSAFPWTHRERGSCCTETTCLCTVTKTCQAVSDARKRERQETGMAVLMSLSVSTALTIPIPVVPVSASHRAVDNCSSQDVHGPMRSRTEANIQPGRWGMLRARLLADHMVRNSLYLILSSGVQAALGAAFWIIAARMFGAANVGIAGSLIAATVLIAYLALLGLNSTLVRYLPTAPDRDGLITGGLLLVAVCGAGLGLLYLLLTPVIAPRLAFVEHWPMLAGPLRPVDGRHGHQPPH